ncbi:MAG TPA: SDR family oxidoreductase [Clostridiales bacterium]|uniref:SDR family oxidoreductase n=1 Tax=Dysosmobacter sp. TaxID=2591382 RepID=UPI0015AAAEDE|nr:SDR family oxidoreductase [Clostridiales bacterium]HJI90467.1 SDR family oxidoreductase [Clostridiales bacterium]
METYKSNYIQKNYVEGKVIIITGASSGFGKLTAKRAAEMGGKIVLAARSEEKLKETVAEIKAAGGEASYIVTDVAKKDDVFAMAKFAVDTYGRIDVLVNNAGTMPLAFFSEHEQALDKWEQCIDISIKGTIFGISAVYDQMIKQGQGQVINVSSIYANFPVAGAGVYQVAKMGVQYLAESLRSECQGKIKVTTIKPTGFMKTNLSSSVVDQMAMMPAVAGPLEILSNWVEEAPLRPDFHDINSMTYNDPDPQVLADNIIYAINQPWGVSIGDLTVRASGESFVI